MIPQSNPYASYESHRKEIDEAIQNVLQSGWYILGEKVASFEQEFAEWHQISHAVGVANGTDALELILRALNIGSGDIVATVANTAVATVSAIERAGAQVRFTDIMPNTYTMSPASLTELLKKESAVKAIIPVHLFGMPASLQEILNIADQFGLPVIEDCAQAHGADINGKKCGTFGIAAAFSFYPTKNLGALGDGGAILTKDIKLAEKIRAIRQYGWEKRYISSFPGINSRLDEIQAAILSVKLKTLAEDNDKRRKIAAVYSEFLQEIPEICLPKVDSTIGHVFHQFVIQAKNRNELSGFLSKKGIGTTIHYPVPIHLQPGYMKIPRPVSLSETETINHSILSLPIFPELSTCDAKTVALAIREFYHV